MEKSFKTKISEFKDRLPEDTEITLQSLRLRIQRFFEQEGRRPRALVGALQRQEGTYPAEQLGALLAEVGFDVDCQPVLNPSDNTARMAVDNDVHAVVFLGIHSGSEPMLRDLAHTLDTSGSKDVVLALDNSGIADRLRHCTSHPLVWFPSASLDSVARLLDALERIH